MGGSKRETPMEPTKETKTESENEPQTSDRRQALAKMGLFAAYTAPLMLGMMTSTKAQTVSGRRNPNNF